MTEHSGGLERNRPRGHVTCSNTCYAMKTSRCWPFITFPMWTTYIRTRWIHLHPETGVWCPVGGWVWGMRREHIKYYNIPLRVRCEGMLTAAQNEVSWQPPSLPLSITRLNILYYILMRSPRAWNKNDFIKIKKYCRAIWKCNYLLFRSISVTHTQGFLNWF